MLIAKTRRRRPDYTAQIDRHPLPIDPYQYPAGGIGDIGDTGILAVDAVIAQTQAKLDTLVFAVQAAAALSAIGAATGLFLLVRGRP
jgi:hypothetical protein